MYAIRYHFLVSFRVFSRACILHRSFFVLFVFDCRFLFSVSRVYMFRLRLFDVFRYLSSVIFIAIMCCAYPILSIFRPSSFPLFYLLGTLLSSLRPLQ